MLVANGMKAPINGMGVLNFFFKEIKDVLFIESFSTNLISIKKLTKELNCNAIFSSNNVIF